VAAARGGAGLPWLRGCVDVCGVNDDPRGCGGRHAAHRGVCSRPGESTPSSVTRYEDRCGDCPGESLKAQPTGVAICRLSSANIPLKNAVDLGVVVSVESKFTSVGRALFNGIDRKSTRLNSS